MLAFALVPGKSLAQTPAYAFNPATQVADTIPLGNSVYNGAQYLFTPSDFAPATPTSGGLITKIYVKAGNANTGNAIFTNMRLEMGGTSLSSLTGATTWLGGASNVYTRASDTITAWTNNQWIPYTLQTPFAWNGTSNIAISVYQSVKTNAVNLKHATISSRVCRNYGNVYLSSTQADNQELVFGFDLSCNGVPDQPTYATSTWNSATPLCSGSTTTVTAVYPSSSVANGITYQWESSANPTGPWASVTGGSGATTLSYTTAALTATTYYRLAATCINSLQTNYSNPFTVPVGSPQPSVIAQSRGFCPGDTVTFSVTNVTGTTYAWTLPAGWSGTSTTNSIVATPGTGTGTVSVTAASACGGTSIARTLNPAPGAPLSAPGSIFGNTQVCPGSTQTYSTLPVGGARSYIWTLPSGWTGSSTTNSITVTAGSLSGNLTVQAVNGCGASIPSNALAVAVTNSLATPGAITGADTVCSGTLQLYSVPPVPGATSYTWVLPSGWSGTTTTNTIQTFPSAGTGFVSVTAAASCVPPSPSSSKLVVALPSLAPVVVVNTSANSICENIPVTFTAVPTNGGSNPGYQWKKNGTAIPGATGYSYTNNHILSSDVITVSMTANSRCQSGVTVTSSPAIVNVTPAVIPGISINTLLPVSVCQGTPLTFYTNVQGTGTNPGYQWYKNNIAITSANGNTYTDAALNDGDTVTVKLSSSATCVTDTATYSNKVGVHIDSIVTPEVLVSVSPSDYIRSGDVLTFTATQSYGGATPTYQWKKNGTDIPFETGDTYVSSNLQPGDHISVRMISYEKCVTSTVVNSNIVILKSALGVAGHTSLAALTLYPNPNNGRFTLSAQGWDAALIGQQLRLDVLSPLGQSVYHVALNPSSADWKTQVDLSSNLANGRYILRVSSADGAFRSTLPFVLNR